VAVVRRLGFGPTLVASHETRTTDAILTTGGKIEGSDVPTVWN